MIYFDNSATTFLCRKAKNAVCENINSQLANPSSLHKAGFEAELFLEETRKKLSSSLSCRANEIIFTSGGTQANNIAVLGAAFAGRKKGKTVITTPIEHPSVSNCFLFLETLGFNVKYLSVDSFGKIDLSELERMLDEDVVLVSAMLVNNELGTILPIKEMSDIVHSKAKNAVFHCDMVQGFGKLETNVKKFGIDLASLSGHKIHASKGIGALYIKEKTKLSPIYCGGGQEKNINPGTQPMPAIASLNGALDEISFKKDFETVLNLNIYIRKKLSEKEGIIINSPHDAIPYILNISVPGYPSEVLLNYLSEKDICVSSGSACAKGKKSKVLSAVNLSEERILSSLRLSFSRYNTVEEADRFIEVLFEAMNRIKSNK